MGQSLRNKFLAWGGRIGGILCLLGITACGGPVSWPWDSPQKPKVRSEVRTVGLYQTVILAGRGDLEFLTEVPSDQVWIRTSARPEARVITGNASGILVLDSGSAEDFPLGSLEFQISSRNPISELRLEGWGDVSTKDTLKSDGFTIRQTGPGRLEMSLDTPAAELHQRGTGQMILRGRSDLQKIYTDGLGWLNAENLRGQKVETHSYGLGQVRVSASESLRVWAVGPVQVLYTGKPALTEFFREPSASGALPWVVPLEKFPYQGNPKKNVSP